MSSRPSRLVFTSIIAMSFRWRATSPRDFMARSSLIPKEGRPPVDREMVMVMSGLDVDFDDVNDFYAVNAIPFYYQNHPIQIKVGEKIRIYLVNILEFDLLNSFHLHANFFYYYPTGTSLTPAEFTDTIIQGQAQRGILEFTTNIPGMYMFHAHVTEFAELGWTGMFEVTELEVDRDQIN